jgi:hypothetical protein
MQVFDMKVHALEADGDCGLVTLRGSFHPIYTSQLFLRVPLEELSKFSIGQSYSLVAQDAPKMIETVPLDAVRSRFDDGSPMCDQLLEGFRCTLPKMHVGQHEAWGETKVWKAWPNASAAWADGSPVPEDTEAAVERRGGYRL